MYRMINLYTKYFCLMLMRIFTSVSVDGLYNSTDRELLETTIAEIKIQRGGQNAEDLDRAFDNCETTLNMTTQRVECLREELIVPLVTINETGTNLECSKVCDVCSYMVTVDSMLKSMEWKTVDLSILLLLGTTFLKSPIPAHFQGIRFKLGVFSFLCHYFKGALGRSTLYYNSTQWIPRWPFFSQSTLPTWQTPFEEEFNASQYFSFFLSATTQADLEITFDAPEITTSLNVPGVTTINDKKIIPESSSTVAKSNICTWAILLGILSAIGFL